MRLNVTMVAGVLALAMALAVVGAFAATDVCAATNGRCIPPGSPSNCEPAGAGSPAVWVRYVAYHDERAYWCAEW